LRVIKCIRACLQNDAILIQPSVSLKPISDDGEHLY
jgi:hypothetical protein